VIGDLNEMPSERRINSIFYDARQEQLITGCSVVEVYPLTRAVQDAIQIPHTHDRPLAVVSLLSIRFTVCYINNIKNRPTAVTTINSAKEMCTMLFGGLYANRISLENYRQIKFGTRNKKHTNHSFWGLRFVLRRRRGMKAPFAADIICYKRISARCRLFCQR